MDMHERSLSIMKMDPIFWPYIVRDIAPRSLLHVHLRAEVFLFPVDIYCEVRMIVDLIWARCEEIREESYEENSKKEEYIFFHENRISTFIRFSSLRSLSRMDKYFLNTELPDQFSFCMQGEDIIISSETLFSYENLW